MYIRPETWLNILEQEYLEQYVRAGGSAVKFAVLLENIDTKDIWARVRDKAKAHGYHSVFVSADTTRIHWIEHTFFAIARQTDWHDLARRYIRILLEENGYTWAEAALFRTADSGVKLSLDELARLNNRIPTEFRRDILIWVEQSLFHRSDMAPEFRTAMIRLCAAQLAAENDAFTPEVGNTVIRWLTGDLRRITELREALIFRKITRNNARNMLNSLSIFLNLTGMTGLLLHLDIARYLVAHRPDVPEGGLYFTKAATMDMYEVIRQLIDGTDRQRHCMTVVTAPIALIQDDKRGIGIYHALRDRMIDEVHDRTRANPVAALVRLALCGEPVAEWPSAAGADDAESINCRRAVEALRCGVPNEDAVRMMCPVQPHIHQRFGLQLEQLVEFPQQQSPGMIVAGGFGGGKSHLLQYLQLEALNRNFVCSKIVISKETPLFDPAKLFQAAMSNLYLPGNHCNDLHAVARHLNVDTDRFRQFEAWLKSDRNSLNERFAASLFLFVRSGTDPEYLDRIIRFWSGENLLTGEMKRRLRMVGEQQSYNLDRVSVQDLAMQRFRFAAQLMVAAGYNGWVLLLDEAELMGRYSLLQRARSYGQMARLLGRVSDWSFEGMTSVIAITDDFQSAVLDEKNDLEKIPNRLLARGSESDRYLAGIAEHCMQIIMQDRIVLRPPDDEVIHRALQQLQKVYHSAYQWTPDDIQAGERLSSTRMRHFIKRWITEWDLKRFYPEHRAEITADILESDYSEDRGYETPTDTDDSDRDDGI